MLSRIFLVVTSLVIPFQVFAFTCYLTVVKSNCWESYNVTVSAMNTATGNSLVSVIVPEDSNWARQKFECQPGMNLQFQAKFTPVFWQTDRGKSYNSIKYWLLPSSPKKGETAWNIPVCYPQEFSEVPMPPQSTGNCKCDFKSVPQLKIK